MKWRAGSVLPNRRDDEVPYVGSQDELALPAADEVGGVRHPDPIAASHGFLAGGADQMRPHGEQTNQPLGWSVTG